MRGGHLYQEVLERDYCSRFVIELAISQKMIYLIKES